MESGRTLSNSGDVYLAGEDGVVVVATRRHRSSGFPAPRRSPGSPGSARRARGRSWRWCRSWRRGASSRSVSSR
jgi:hypothetical protein